MQIYDYRTQLVNGTLQEGNVLRLMESSNEKSDMQKGYDAVERCKNKGGSCFFLICVNRLYENLLK